MATVPPAGPPFDIAPAPAVDVLVELDAAYARGELHGKQRDAARKRRARREKSAGVVAAQNPYLTGVELAAAVAQHRKGGVKLKPGVSDKYKNRWEREYNSRIRTAGTHAAHLANIHAARPAVIHAARPANIHAALPADIDAAHLAQLSTSLPKRLPALASCFADVAMPNESAADADGAPAAAESAAPVVSDPSATYDHLTLPLMPPLERACVPATAAAAGSGAVHSSAAVAVASASASKLRRAILASRNNAQHDWTYWAIGVRVQAMLEWKASHSGGGRNEDYSYLRDRISTNVRLWVEAVQAQTFCAGPVKLVAGQRVALERSPACRFPSAEYPFTPVDFLATKVMEFAHWPDRARQGNVHEKIGDKVLRAGDFQTFMKNGRFLCTACHGLDR